MGGPARIENIEDFARVAQQLSDPFCATPAERRAVLAAVALEQVSGVAPFRVWHGDAALPDGLDFIALPGGFGTLDEMFEVLTLVQTKKITPVPIVLVGKEFWEGLKNWIVEVMLERHHNINAEDMNLFHITDDVDEVHHIINQFYKERPEELSQNFGL